MNFIYKFHLNLIQSIGVRKYANTILLVFLAAIIEAVGLAVFVPISKIIFEIPKSEIILNLETKAAFIGIIVVFSYFMRFLLLIAINLYLSNQIAFVRVQTSKNFLLQFLFNSGGDDKSNDNISGAYKNIIVEADIIASSFQAFLFLIVECVVISILLLSMILFFRLNFLYFFVIFLVFLIIYAVLSKRYSAGLGKEREEYEKQRQEITYDILNARTDLIKYHAVNPFLEKFHLRSMHLASAWSKLNVLSQSPRSYLEFAITFSLIIYAIISFYNNVEVVETLSFFASIVVVFLRLLPSVNRIISSLQLLTFHRISLQNYPSNINFLESQKITNIVNSIKFHEVSTPYTDILFTKVLNKGKIYGFKARSGKGKSVLLDAIMGVRGNLSGKIECDIGNGFVNISNYEDYISYVPQTVGLVTGTIWENICLNEENYKYLNTNFPQLGLQFDKVISGQGLEISGGERKRIGFLRALYHQHNILFFDEVFVGNDQKSKIQMYRQLDLIKDKSIILIVSHDSEVLGICDEIIEF